MTSQMNEESKRGCLLCERREFLKQMGLLMGGLAVPTGVMARFGDHSGHGIAKDKTGAVKVRLVFSIWDDIQVRKTWPNVGYDFRNVLTYITDRLNEGVEGVQFIPGKAYDAATVDAILAEDAKAGDIAGYMVIQMNSWPDSAKNIANKTDKPLLFCSYNYSGIGGWCTVNSSILRSKRKGYAFISSLSFEDTVGAARAFAALKDGTPEDFVKAATDYRLAHTPAPSQFKLKAGHTKCLTPDETLGKIKGFKILSVERDRPDLFEKIRKDFGIEVEAVPFEILNSYARNADGKLAEKLARKWKNKAQYVEAVTDETLLGCAKLFYGMKNILADKKAQAITVNCLGGCYTGKLDSYPCLGFMQLQDEGLFGVCEDDLESTVTMMVFNAMTKGLMGYVSDPAIDSSHRAIVYAHCVSTRRFFGPKGKEYPYEILTHSEDRMGASVRAIAPAAYPVTTVKFNIYTGKMAVHTGVVTGNDPDDRACRTKIVAEVIGDYEKIYRQWDAFKWHRVTFLGDFAEEAEAFAKHIGYTVVKES